MREGRRRKIVPIDPQLLYALLTKGNFIQATCIEGLPEGAIFIGHDYDPLKDLHYLVFEADEWEPVGLNEMLPLLIVQYMTHHEPCGTVSTEGASWAMEGTQLC